MCAAGVEGRRLVRWASGRVGSRATRDRGVGAGAAIPKTAEIRQKEFPPSARAATASLDGDAGAVVDYERGCSGKGRKATPGRHMTSIRSKQSTANKKSDGRAQNTYFHSLV